ncbi:MAG: Stp1/IreP family PP2C-type Ser/Thr phosphatase [Parachlamydiaceae bacterium]
MQEQIEIPSLGQTSFSEESVLGMAAPQVPYKILSVGRSDIGLVRLNNEDAWDELPAIGLYILADGMGGHQAGEVAAKETIEALCRIIKRKYSSIKNAPIAEVRELVRQAIIHVNKLIYRLGRTKPELRGMGTTLCCLLFHREGVVLAHVGDSRIYRLRGSKLELLTRDHSLLCQLIDLGQLNPQQASDFLYKNIITKAIGTEPKVEPTVDSKRVLRGDLFLMCSDGLTDPLACEEIASILKSTTPLEITAEQLIHGALEKGGRDNITVVLAFVEPGTSKK